MTRNSQLATRNFFLLLLLLGANHIFARSDSVKFRSPLDIPINLSGTFGEIRGTHFHSGIDIRTNGAVGLPVFAAEKGYVSRIKISKTAYGNALYIQHPNGYTTVYAHLQNYSDKIGQYIKAIQYRKESFEVDEYLPAGLITVARGEVIALSGNSGMSGAAHLHFEVRDSKSEHPLNPLSFQNSLNDNIAPVMNDLLIYPMNNSKGKVFPLRVKPIKENGTYSLSKDTVHVGFSKIGFGINVYDFMDGRSSQNGVYELTLRANDKTIYHFAMDEISFSETRFVQSHMDYPAKQKDKITVHRCYRLPGNILPFYDTLVNSGLITLDTSEITRISIIAKDFNGNASVLNFFIQFDTTVSPPDFSSLVYDTAFDYRDDNIFQNDEVHVFLPKNTCYDSVLFNYEKLGEPVEGKIFSSIHQIHREEEPAQLYFTLSIKQLGLPEDLRSKALIIRETEKLDAPEAKESTWDGEFLKARTRDFGKYYIVIDTVPPVIKPINIYNNKDLTTQKSIQVKITDVISGINTYRGAVDGQWILMEYDEKNDLLTYYFDDHVKPGEHFFGLLVTDEIGNQSTYQIKFRR